MSFLQSIVRRSIPKLNLSIGNTLRSNFEIDSSLRTTQWINNITEPNIITPLINQQNMVSIQPFQMMDYRFEECRQFENLNHQKEQREPNFSKFIQAYNNTLFSKPNFGFSLIQIIKYEFSKFQFKSKFTKSQRSQYINTIPKKTSQLEQNGKYKQIIKQFKNLELRELRELRSIFIKTQDSSPNKERQTQDINITNWILQLQIAYRNRRLKVPNSKQEIFKRWVQNNVPKENLIKKSVFKQKNFKNFEFVFSYCVDGYLSPAKGRGAGSHHGGPRYSLYRSKDMKSFLIVDHQKKNLRNEK